jgi:hypothetical protein
MTTEQKIIRAKIGLLELANIAELFGCIAVQFHREPAARSILHSVERPELIPFRSGE